MTRTVTFDEAWVRDWCETNDDPNPIHTDAAVAEESSFGQRIVPGMMIINQLSGMMTTLGEDDDEVIFAGITAARFRDPVLLDEEVTFEFIDYEEGNSFDTVEFEARVEDRGESLVANGALSVVIK